MKLLPGDHVAQKDLTDEQYHAIAERFIEAGATKGEYMKKRQWSDTEYFGWDIMSGCLFHGMSGSGESGTHFNGGRLLTPSQILEDDAWSGEGFPPINAVCEAYIRDGWREVEILKRGNDACACHMLKVVVGGRNLYWSARFRPIKSDRDKAIAAACKVIEAGDYNTHIDISFVLRKAIEDLIDAGFKLPEGEK